MIRSADGRPTASPPALLNDTLLRAARRERVDHVPVWLHRQAGRYLPEFRATRQRGGDFFALCRSPQLSCEVTLQPCDRFPLDAAIIFSDILVVVQALGLAVEMREGVGPVLPEPLRDPTHLDRLLPPEQLDVERSLGYVFDAVAVTRQQLAGRVPLIGFSGAPWTLMAYMVEGSGGGKAWNAARSWFYRYPEAARSLLQRLVDVIVPYLVGQVLAGAQMLEVFDTWAGDLPPEVFREFCLPGLAQIASRVKAELRRVGADQVPMTVFPRGAHFALEWLAEETEYDVISLDWAIDPAEARRRVGGRVALQGNLDPAVLYAPPDVIDREVGRMLERFGPHGYICNLGHGMLPDHTPEAVAAVVESVHRRSREMLRGGGGGDTSTSTATT